ncbi:response regulator transcription factor [Alkalicoccobacillus murimartini]|uniref:DNA-binding response OmpR family regulator n=1 Tax=Alkalicoccobacillus murimartini TaxID=171685 RepID=A0ABT9YLB0_9BACI|nr:response regulator transcription factor [Alkalicoccobacillus murimartini]MDQ0208672.1 DNA-binding response OmpR family regulator [Alkalicoccobacillus murimartini]
MPPKILIIDDDVDIRNLIEVYLVNEGMDTVKAENAVVALQLLEYHDFDLVILDIMMPEMDGIEACIKIREERNMPIIMLSAKSEDMDKIQGLTSGADDYLTKPFNPLELMARVKSQLRRMNKYNDHNTRVKNELIEIGELEIHLDTHQVFVEKNEVRLTPKQFDILALLARNKGIVLSIQKIYETVWQEDFSRSDNTVMVHITNIRNKIEQDPKHPIYIKTIWGVGYKI